MPTLAVIRPGWVKISKPSARATATSVMPAASAIRTASAVGAETATITGAPSVAAFCTISTETRLVRSTMPSLAETLASASAPHSLSSALWRPTSSRKATMPCGAVQNAAACTARVSRLISCSGARLCTAVMISAWVTCPPKGTMAAGRSACAMESTPHRPQPVGPAICRRRALISSARAGGSHMRSSMPSSSAITSMEVMSSADCTMPSLKEKPTANSVRSCGVAAQRNPLDRHDGAMHASLRGFGRHDPARLPGLRLVGFLPVARAVGRRDLHRRHLVFGAVGGPVRIVGGDDVGLRVRVMEGGVDHARRDPLGDSRAQGRLAGAARKPDPVAVAHAALLGIVRMDLQPVLLMPDHIVGAPGLGADIVLAEDTAGGEQQRIARAGALVGRDIFGDDELALAADEAVDMHHRRSLRRLLVAGPLQRAEIGRASCRERV